LGQVPVDSLPPALKRVASFAPNRRAKLAGSQIVAVLEADRDFRERLGNQVRTLVPELVVALDAGAPPPAADPVEVAAVAYLIRPPGWVAITEAAVVAVIAERGVEASQQSLEQVAHVRRQLESATDELKQTRQKHREELARLKSDNTELRHKLGDVRARLRAAEAAAEDAARQLADAQRSGQVVGAQSEADLRRLRGRVEELEVEVATLKRAERAERSSGTLRARLLLDTLLDTAQGLRRELALPASEGLPADQVEAHIAEQGVRTSSGHGSLATDDPTMLDALVALPRAHMIVDGYNVTKTTWPESSLEKQRDRLLSGLAPLVARSGAEVTVVFDAADKKERPLVNRPRGVRVLFSPHGVIADDVIRELVAAEPQGRPVVVVSSDQEVARDVTRAGARCAAASALGRLLARA
jgi:predicted RNA-binding protein with PIN domain